MPALTWLNYESGVTMPAETLLKFIVETNVDPHWLLTGKGSMYFEPDESGVDAIAESFDLAM